MWAENDAGARSRASCSIPTYDVTLPGGRFNPDYLSTSNPDVMKAQVKVYEDSPITMTQVGLGYGKMIWGDQVVAWNDVSVEPDDFVLPDLSIEFRRDSEDFRNLCQCLSVVSYSLL